MSSSNSNSSIITHSIPIIKKNASFLLAWQLQNKNILIIGGGNVGLSRIIRAIQSDANVFVIAPIVHDHVKIYNERNDITWIKRYYKDSDIDDYKPDMVLTAINNSTISSNIAKECRKRNIPVNVADVPELCDFYFMSEHRDGPLQIGISTNGNGPALAIRIRKHIQSNLPENSGKAIEKIGNLRKKLRKKDSDPNNANKRMPWMSYICKNWPIEYLANLSEDQMESLVTQYNVNNLYLPNINDYTINKKAKIYMIGAGLGDPELLTVKAYKLLNSVDLVISDRLISDKILSLIKCEIKIARKIPGSASSAQDEINNWGLQALQEGKTIIRLKSGDPFLYGRAGEEILWYRSFGYEPEIVPGISSILCPGIEKVPITHRGISNQVLIISGHNLNGSFPYIPEYYQERTIILLMGVGRLEKISKLFLEKNYPSDLSVCIIEKASHIDSRKIYGNLTTISKLAKENNIEAPATIVFGNVVNCLSQTINK